MVFIKFHKEKIETVDGRIKETEIQRLEQRILDLGWTKLRWCPSNPQEKEDRWVLIGLPPNYDGPYADYYEEAIITLAMPGKPGYDSGEIKVRDYLKGPVFKSPEGVGWY